MRFLASLILAQESGGQGCMGHKGTDWSTAESGLDSGPVPYGGDRLRMACILGLHVAKVAPDERSASAWLQKHAADA